MAPVRVRFQRAHGSPGRLFSAVFALSLAATACQIPMGGNSSGPSTATQAVSSALETTIPTLEPTPTQTLTPISGSATSFPNPLNYQWMEVVSGLKSPVGIANAGDGSGRLFIVQQAGSIRIGQQGYLLRTTFLQVAYRLGSSVPEMATTGCAFHTRFIHSRYCNGY